MLKKVAVYIMIIASIMGGFGACADDDTNITSPDFKIKVDEITPGGAALISTRAETTVENILKRTIERFIIAIGTIALLVMTIGAGLIILYTGEDERLTRGKTIFTGGLIAVAIALLSGLMVQLVGYLLYI